MRVLNVGGNTKAIPIPPHYDGWEHVLLDVDPVVAPDICLDARDLIDLEGEKFDAVYCSHNLEHFYAHDVARVVEGIHHVLTDDGFAHIVVPDIVEALRLVNAAGIDLSDELYVSPAGPVSVIDMLYGMQSLVASGYEFFAHKTAFTKKSLTAALDRFPFITGGTANLNLTAFAFKREPDTLTLLSLSRSTHAAHP